MLNKLSHNNNLTKYHQKILYIELTFSRLNFGLKYLHILKIVQCIKCKMSMFSIHFLI